MENNGYEIKPGDDTLNDILLVGTDLVSDKLKGADRGDAYRKFADLADTNLKYADRGGAYRKFADLADTYLKYADLADDTELK